MAAAWGMALVCCSAAVAAANRWHRTRSRDRLVEHTAAAWGMALVCCSAAAVVRGWHRAREGKWLTAGWWDRD